MADTGRKKPSFDFLSKEQVTLPVGNKLISEFATEAAVRIADKEKFFFRPDSQSIIEIRKIKTEDDNDLKFIGFSEMQPTRFVTLIEDYMTPGFYKSQDGDIVFKRKSISAQLSKILLCSSILQDKLPYIDRIFTIPLPIMYKDELTFPKVGYDARFKSWLPHDAPKITNTNMTLQESKDLLNDIFKEFCFETDQDRINAIAALLTPFLRGLFSKFNVRTPVYFYLANRERAGKDYCAGITSVVYEGHVIEDPPLSTSENAKSNNTEELRKKILSALIYGRKRMHFSNNKGYINNAAFEGIVTSEKHSDRLLGKNELMTLDNEIDFSLSGNAGVGFTPDFANRCRFIRLFLDIEDANARNFSRPDLHRWIKANRSKVLSALYALVRNWVEKDKPKGQVLFSSFHEWANICGGIMEAAGYTSPCTQDKTILNLGGDTATRDMKDLFVIAYKKYPDEWIKKATLVDIIIENEGNSFSYINFDKRSDQIKFAQKLIKFVGRILSDIRLEVDDASLRTARQKFRFTKIKPTKTSDLGTNGHVGNDGKDKPQQNIEKINILNNRETSPSLPSLPHSTKQSDLSGEIR